MAALEVFMIILLYKLRANCHCKDGNIFTVMLSTLWSDTFVHVLFGFGHIPPK